MGTYLEVIGGLSAKVVDLAHDGLPQVLVLVRHWVKLWLNGLNDSILGALVLVTEVQEEHPADLAIKLLLLELVHRLTLAFVNTVVLADANWAVDNDLLLLLLKLSLVRPVSSLNTTVKSGEIHIRMRGL